MKKNNIHFACEAFKFISKGDCYVMVGDFKGFFDNLKHNFLKEKLIQVLNVPTLDRDWYNIYKNITRFSTINLLDVLNVNDILSSDEILEYENVTKRIENNNTRKARKMLKKIDNKINEFNEYNIDYNKRIRKKALSSKQFKELKSGVALNKSKVGIEINRSRVGIPQGAALSSVLSNVYMIDFDKNISEVVKKHNGIYFRYSDDFIIVIPKNQNLELDLKQLIEDYSSKYGGLKLENKKTKTYEFNSGNIETKDKKKYVDYLGFTFDGKCVKIRDKTLSKFYSRLHKKLNFIVECNGVTKYNNKISNRILYKNYSMKGRSGFISMNDIRNGKRLSHKDGNFLTYVYKANKIFNCFNNVHPYNSFDIDTNAINKTRTRNLVIIRRKLKKIKC